MTSRAKKIAKKVEFIIEEHIIKTSLRFERLKISYRESNGSYGSGRSMKGGSNSRSSIVKSLSKYLTPPYLNTPKTPSCWGLSRAYSGIHEGTFFYARSGENLHRDFALRGLRRKCCVSGKLAVMSY